MFPAFGHRRSDFYVAFVQADAQNPLDRQAPCPGRRSSIPAPSSLSDMLSARAYVTGDDIGFDPVESDFVRIVRPPYGADHLEYPVRPVGLPRLGESQAQPSGSVAVLPAILAQSGRIGANIAGIAWPLVEWRPEQPYQTGILVDQFRPGGIERCFHTVRIGPSERRPRLRDGIDPAFPFAGRPERVAIVVVGAAIPVTVPARLLRPPDQRRSLFRPVAAFRLSTQPRLEIGEHACTDRGKPGKPDAFAFSGTADPVHTVVPVSRAHQRKAVSAACKALERSFAMLDQGDPNLPGLEQGVAILFIFGEGRSLKKGDLLTQDRDVAGRTDVSAGRERQPLKVVREARADTAIVWWMPPVKNVALLELMRGAGKDMGPRPPRVGVKERQHVLQLVPESNRAARLVEAAAGEDAR